MPTTAEIINLDTTRPAFDKISNVAQILAQGKIGIIPTRCLYGLATNAFNTKAVNRIFTIKGRAFQKPLLVLISHPDQVKDLAIDISPLAEKLMQRFWPGRVTFLLRAQKNLPKGLVGEGNKVGIRLVGHPVTKAVVTHAGVPLTGTSANLSGRPGCYRIDQMNHAVLTAVDLVIDSGPLLGGKGSSVVDITLPIPQMLREGTLGAEEFNKVLAEL
ncbi:MAG: L-threonylcarbamoyladenylate synthase [Desulfobacteraceae bacterium]